MYWFTFLIVPKHSFDCTKMPSPQHCYGEGSLLQRRAFADSTTSPRATS